MSVPTAVRWVSLLCLGSALRAFAAPAADGFAPEVYRDAHLTVHAGIAPREGEVVELGDVLSLVIRISWDADAVTLEEPGQQLFPDAWAGGFTPVLLESRQMRRKGTGAYTDEIVYVFRFQIVSCPGAEPSCPGNRQYPLQDLTLRYRSKHAADPVSVKFRPRPDVVAVTTAIERDADNRLYPFASYFPSGAYPDPLPVADRTGAALMVLGTGSVMLIGGILMWPFRFRRKQLFATDQVPRWQTVLHDLQNEDEADERRLADRMRRCLVWYCSDSLNVDPFEWLAPGGNDYEAAHAELRGLFIDLLHDPSGRGAELRVRLASLVPGRA